MCLQVAYFSLLFRHNNFPATSLPQTTCLLTYSRIIMTCIYITTGKQCSNSVGKVHTYLAAVPTSEHNVHSDDHVLFFHVLPTPPSLLVLNIQLKTLREYIYYCNW